MRFNVLIILSLFAYSHVLANKSATEHSCKGITKKYFSNDPDNDTVLIKYRTYNRQQFKVLDTAFLWIYQYQTKVVDMVRVSVRSTKVVNKVVIDYYFSLNGQSELFQFTLSNMKLLFLLNQSSYQELCEKFKTTESLLGKSEKGTFLINDFLKQQIKEGINVK